MTITELKTMTDKELKQHVQSALDWEPSVDATDIGVSVDEGVVTLRGNVGSYMEKLAAERVVLRLYGVKALANGLVVHLMTAYERTDTEIGGRVIPAGERVLVNYGAANHDPREFPDPERFDVHRAASKPLTFSAGPHRCIGSNMARMSLRIVVEEFFERGTDFRFADGQGERRVSFSPGAWRACDSLPITFTPR